MNDIGVPGSGSALPDDETLLADLGRFLDELDPPPDDLVQRVQFALELENLDVEIARWERAGELPASAARPRARSRSRSAT